MYSKIFIFMTFFLSLLFPQVNIGEWDAYTSPLEIRSMVVKGDSIISASKGGLLIKSQNQFTTLSTINGIFALLAINDIFSISNIIPVGLDKLSTKIHLCFGFMILLIFLTLVASTKSTCHPNFLKA